MALDPLSEASTQSKGQTYLDHPGFNAPSHLRTRAMPRPAQGSIPAPRSFYFIAPTLRPRRSLRRWADPLM